MLSPKFSAKKKDLNEVINSTRLKSTWKSKVREAMRRQPIPDPLENLDFHTHLDASCTALVAEVMSGSYLPRPPIRLTSEKAKGLCRQLVVPSTKDALILQTLSDALWVELREKAPTKKAFYAPEDHSFSKPIKGHSLEYGPVKAWISFQEQIIGFSKTKKFIVVTDVANYYDFISYDHLRNKLAGLSLIREHTLDLLIFTLSHMLWQPDYMPRVMIGMPQMNLDAPRLLAHCFLFEIDEHLSRVANADFARYMDDIDIGVDSVWDAKKAIRDLDLILQTRQIRLNSGKTKIMTENEARKHFKVFENMMLDKLSERIVAINKAGGDKAKIAKLIRTAINVGLKRGTFGSGNGEKILKRLINFARETDCKIDKSAFENILLNWPALREVLLGWWQSSEQAEEMLPQILEFVEKGHMVDDFSQIKISVSAVTARLPEGGITHQIVPKLLELLDDKSVWGFYAKAWILSKYGTEDDLIELVEKRSSVWVSEEHLSRLVASLFARIYGSKHEEKFERILSRAGNIWSLSVLEFCKNLATEKDVYLSISKFILATNNSLPNAISHSKFLLLLLAIKNPSLAKSIKENLVVKHAKMLKDPFY